MNGIEVLLVRFDVVELNIVSAFRTRQRRGCRLGFLDCTYVYSEREREQGVSLLVHRR